MNFWTHEHFNNHKKMQHQAKPGSEKMAAVVIQSWWRGVATRAALCAVHKQYCDMVLEVEQRDHVPIFYSSKNTLCMPELYQQTKQTKVMPKSRQDSNPRTNSKSPGSQIKVSAQQCNTCTKCGTVKSQESAPVAEGTTHSVNTNSKSVSPDTGNRTPSSEIANPVSTASPEDRVDGDASNARPSEKIVVSMQEPGKKDAMTETENVQETSNDKRTLSNGMELSGRDQNGVLLASDATAEQEVNTGDSLLDPSRDEDTGSGKSVDGGKETCQVGEVLDGDENDMNNEVRHSRLSEFTNVTSCNFSDVTSVWDRNATEVTPAEHRAVSISSSSQGDEGEGDRHSHSHTSDSEMMRGCRQTSTSEKFMQGGEREFSAVVTENEGHTGNTRKSGMTKQAGDKTRTVISRKQRETLAAAEKEKAGNKKGNVPAEKSRSVTRLSSDRMPEMAVKGLSVEHRQTLEKERKGLSVEERQGLEEERQTLVMELLWVQQAITSRKQYLHLKESMIPAVSEQSKQK